jgi:cell division protein FtsA
VLTQSFSLDGQDGIADPVGLNGKQLSVDLHVVLNANAVVENMVNVINRAGIVVRGVVMQPLASAEAVLTEDEKELGTVLVDIGGGTTDISVYSQGSIWHSQVLPLGGSLITKDIAIGLKVALSEADEIKCKLGNACSGAVPEEEVVEIREMGTGRLRTVSRRLLSQIIEARCDEILVSVGKVIRHAGVQSELTSGVVLTGGGSLLHGIVERAQQILDIPVRIGHPLEFGGGKDVPWDPTHSTSLGLLKYARDFQEAHSRKASKPAFRTKAKVTREWGLNWPLDRLWNWIFEKV